MPTPARACSAATLMLQLSKRIAGPTLNESYTRTFSLGKVDAPPDILQLGGTISRDECQAPHDEKFSFLACSWGMPCSSNLRSCCISPQANHVLRNRPPDDITTYAVAHNAALWERLLLCLGAAGLEDARDARCITVLPPPLSAPPARRDV